MARAGCTTTNRGLGIEKEGGKAEPYMLKRQPACSGLLGEGQSFGSPQ